jgi:hypothetical protein
MDGIKNEFDGFGEGFEGFPKHLPDDCVEYSLFIIESKLKSQKEVLARLETVRKQSQKLSDSLLKDYIWQRDGFKLEIKSQKGASYVANHEVLANLRPRNGVLTWPYELWRFGR